MYVGKYLCHLCTSFTKFSLSYAEVKFTLESTSALLLPTRTETRSHVNALVVGIDV
jgi:hypothetical protein